MYISVVADRFGVPLTNEHEVIRFFNDSIDAWGMDVFHLNDITNGHPLVATACAIFRVSPPECIFYNESCYVYVRMCDC